MKLLYKIEYFSKNSYFPALIQEIMELASINAFIAREDRFLIICIDDTPQKIEHFFGMLGEKLPLSIYIGETSLQEVEQIDYVPMEIAASSVNLSLGAEAVEKILDENSPLYCDPFYTEGIYGANRNIAHAKIDTESLYIENKKEKNVYKKGSFKNFFDDLAKILSENKIVRLKGLNGITYLTRKPLLDSPLEYSILLLDANILNTAFSLSHREFLSLSSIERPKIELNILEDFNTANSISKISSIEVRMPFCGFEFLLAKSLRDYGILYLYEMHECDNYDYEAYFISEDLHKQEHLKVCAFDNITLIEDGEIALLPFAVDAKSDLTYANLAVLQEGDGYAINTSFDSYDSLFFKEKEYKFAIQSVIKEGALHTNKIAASYLSLDKAGSSFCVYKEGSGVHKLIDIDATNCDMTYALEALGKSNKKLLENFSATHKSEIKRWEKYDYKGEGTLKSVLGLLSIFAGTDAKNYIEAYTLLVNHLRSYGGERSVKIDMKLKKGENRLALDLEKSLGAILSYRLAGVETRMLCYGICESFMDFTNDMLHEICKQNDTKVAVATGSLFGEPFFAKRLTKHSKNLYNLHFPRGISLEGMNILYGAL